MELRSALEALQWLPIRTSFVLPLLNILFFFLFLLIFAPVKLVPFATDDEYPVILRHSHESCRSRLVTLPRTVTEHLPQRGLRLVVESVLLGEVQPGLHHLLLETSDF